MAARYSPKGGPIHKDTPDRCVEAEIGTGLMSWGILLSLTILPGFGPVKKMKPATVLALFVMICWFTSIPRAPPKPP